MTNVNVLSEAQSNAHLKICCRCNLPKSKDQFFKDKYSPDGLTYRCKDCDYHSKTRKTRHNTAVIADLPGEVWEDVVGYEGLYIVSNMGRVKSVERVISDKLRGKAIRKSVLLSSSKNGHGYLNCVLSKNNKSKHLRVHILVWEAFGDAQRDGREIVVDHIDNDKENCKFSNLQLLPQRMNVSKDRNTNHLTGTRYSRGKWLSMIKVNKKDYCLGSFDTEIEAHDTYFKALIEVETGVFNHSDYKKVIPKTSKYVGVCKVKGRDKWHAYYKHKNIGWFNTEEEAYQAFLQHKAAS
jgi:hypothetical protein